jgi:hypothetical protein
MIIKSSIILVVLALGVLGVGPLVIPPIKRTILWLVELPGVYRKSMEEAKKVQAER